MVTMVSFKPMTAVERGRAAGEGGRFRTRAAAPALRLTRRGRVVAAGASALAIGGLSIVLATTAQASHAGQATPGGYAAKVEVAAGQSLWSLAEAYDPDADPRLVVQQIQQLNSMAGDQLRPGEMLWVPRG
jgi:coenzyme F420-reducing hydrogenase alpha subunit